MARSAALLLCAGAAATGANAFVGQPGGSASAPLRLRQAAGAAGLPSAAELTPGAPLPEAGAEQAPSLLKWVGAGLLAGLVLAVSSAPAHASANSAVRFAPQNFTIKKAKHLEFCKDNKKYHKRIKDEIFKITKKQSKYPKGSVVYNSLAQKISLVKKREVGYGDRYCGKKDGLPRTIATGELVKGGVVVPSLMFLYTAGWIGWAGRSYLLRTGDRQKEMNLDVPLALTCMASGFSWPVAAWQAIVNGEMARKDTDFHRSFF